MKFIYTFTNTIAKWKWIMKTESPEFPVFAPFAYVRRHHSDVMTLARLLKLSSDETYLETSLLLTRPARVKRSFYTTVQYILLIVSCLVWSSSRDYSVDRGLRTLDNLIWGAQIPKFAKPAAHIQCFIKQGNRAKNKYCNV